MSRVMMLLLALLAAVTVTRAAEAPLEVGIGEKVVIEDEVLARWDKISRMGVGPRAQAFIAEGEAVLERYRELQSLEATSENVGSVKELNIEISKLKLTLIHLLHSIEEARLFDLNAAQLADLRAEYEQERQELLARRGVVREEVLMKGEDFLQSYRRDRSMQRFSQRDVVAKLCLQLAELYYAKSEEDYFALSDEMLSRIEAGLPPGTEPVKDFEDAVFKYQRIIDEFPFSDYMDDALYNVAYIRENSLDNLQVEESRRLYEQLVRDFPGSHYAPESWMRLGEYWFRKDGESALREAVAHYEKILDYPDYPSREKALYKLGWCHYRMQEHEASVEYFAEAARYAMRQASEDGFGGDLLDESIGYIAVNYADPEWEKATVGDLSALVRSDDELRQGFGFELMQRYGDLFREETQDFTRAVSAYDSLLAIFPDHPQAPFIQEKVILCYAPGALADPEMAYQEKNQLVESYGMAGAWTEANPDGVSRLLEQHLQENVTIAMSRAYRTRSRGDFEEFVSQSRRYLKDFSTDSSAWTIHWNMAKTMEKELEDYEGAFDEYLNISQSYETGNRRDAAYNAIVVSQILVDSEVPAEDMALEGPTAPTPMEERKLAALDNFIELFPEDEAAPDYRLVAGKLYYSHQDYAGANAQFDALISAWPAAPQVAEAYQLKLEGLFAQGLFQEAEEIARVIQGMGLGEDVAERARTRQAESVYAFAESLKESEDHAAAAEEFRRMALDVPDAPFADASLFDAANEFSLAGDPVQASETYLYLAATYPQSDFADRAVSLAGFIQLNELKDLRRAAEVFEQLAMDYPDSEYSKAGISNSAYCYEKVEDWTSTIRMNGLYVDRHSDAEDAAAILFNNAGLYLKLDDIASANRIYADFAARFPDDPRTVQAFVERADYFLTDNDELAARAEYTRAVQRNRELLARGGTGNALYASRALRRVVGWTWDEYAGMEIQTPVAVSKSDLNLKTSARDALLEDLNELISLGTGDVFYARYMIAAVNEEFARAYREQARESYRSTEAKIKAEVELTDAAHELARFAATSYISTTHELEGAIESLRRQREDIRQRQSRLEDYIQSQELAAETVNDDSLSQRLALTRAADLVDSSLAESSIWTTRSREKVPELLLASLGEYEKRLDYALELKSQYRDDPFLRFADTDRNLLSGAALVTFGSVVAAYNEALTQISEVGLGRLWRPRLAARLGERLNLLPDAYASFRNETWQTFDRKVRTFLEVVDMGEDYSDADGLYEEDHGNDVLDMADFNQGYAVNSLMIHDQMASVLEQNQLLGDLGLQLSDSLASRALAFNREMRHRRQNLDSLKEVYWARFEESASYVFRDAHSTLDDASYFLGQTATAALVNSEPVVSRLNPSSMAARRLFFVLAEEDPARFGDRFGLAEEQLLHLSNSAWLSSPSYVRGFVDRTLNDADWQTVASGNPALDGLIEGAASIWKPVIAVAEADSQETAFEAGLDSMAVASVDTSYFRYSFDVDGSPVGATLRIAADDNFFLFFNGEYIDERESAYEEAGIQQVHEYQLDEFLEAGKNTIAVEVHDVDASGGGLALRFEARKIAELTEELFERQLQDELIRQRRADFEKSARRIYGKNRVD
jgi:TolA-binding protein